MPRSARLTAILLIPALLLAGCQTTAGGPIPDGSSRTADGSSRTTAGASGAAGCIGERGGAPGPEPAVVPSYAAHRAAVTDVAFAPDGSRLVSAGDDGNARIWTPDGATSATHPVGRYPTAVAWSPNGACLAGADSTGHIVIWAAATGTGLARLDGHHDRVYGLAWSADGRLLASGGWDATAVLWDVATGSARQSFHAASPVGHVAFSPDNARLALATKDGSVVVLRTSDGQLDRRLSMADAPLWSVAWSPDGSHIAAGVGDYDATFGAAYGVQVFDTTGTATPRRLAPTTGPVWTVAWSPDGDRLAVAGGTFGGLHPPAAFADYQVVVLRAADASVAWRGGGHTDSVWALSWSPDGRYLASASQDGTVRVADTR